MKLTEMVRVKTGFRVRVRVRRTVRVRLELRRRVKVADERLVSCFAEVWCWGAPEQA